MNTLCILGRQPTLGLAELESLFGDSGVVPVGTQAALLDVEADAVPFARLGGTIKLCRVITKLPSANWEDIQSHLINHAPDHARLLPDGKLKLGLSVYGLSVNTRRLQATGLELKRALRQSGRSARIVPNKDTALSSAQVLHNNLCGPLGWELVLVKDNQQTILAQTVAVQDIGAYAARDQARPKRDARVGMLPPKLAQIIINLATGPTAKDRQKTTDDKSHQSPTTVMDPFCGTGVILQEALLAGYKAYGTDLDQRMIDYSEENIKWLRSRRQRILPDHLLETADATNHQWQPFDAVACETYLGRPFSALPDSGTLQNVIQDVNTIHRNFLRNLTSQTRSGLKICIAIPSWKTPNGFKHLPILDSLTQLGYNRVSFVHAVDEDLIYYRPNQIVGRELVVLTRT